MRLTFDNGTVVDVPEDVKELDLVTVIDRRQNQSQVMWGSVIAHSNGEALKLYEQALKSN